MPCYQLNEPGNRVLPDYLGLIYRRVGAQSEQHRFLSTLLGNPNISQVGVELATQ